MPRPSKGLTPHRQRVKLTPQLTTKFEITSQTIDPSQLREAMRVYCRGVIRALNEEREENLNHGKSLGFLQTFNR